MLYWTLVTVNIVVAIANFVILGRCWRTMRKIDKMHAETAETLFEVIALQERFRKLNQPMKEPPIIK